MRWPLPTLIGLVAGCGLLGGQDPMPAPQDGLGPFDRPTPVEVCLGTTRWVAAASGPLGFCVSGSRPDVGCTGPGGCRGAEQCVCGRCTVPVCASDADCGQGGSCQPDTGRCEVPCTVGSPCPAGQPCRDGLCAMACTRTEDCAHGEHCDSRGLCVALPCTDNGSCGGDRCDLQRTVRAMQEPSVVTPTGGTTAVLYLEVDHQAVWRAVSTDGLRFTVDPPHAVLASVNGRVGAPSGVQLPDGRWVLAAAQGDDQAIVLAASPDGLTFGPATPVLMPQEPWENGHLGSPGIVWFSHTLLLSYTAGTGIGLATVQIMPGGSGVGTRVRDSWSRTARVLDPERVTDSMFWRSVDVVAGPDLVAVHTPAGRDVLRMYFTARGAESSSTVSNGTLHDPPIHWSVGVAAATDDGPWRFSPSPFNPVLTQIDGPGELLDAREPAVWTHGATAVVLLRGETLNGTDQGLFTTPP